MDKKIHYWARNPFIDKKETKMKSQCGKEINESEATLKLNEVTCKECLRRMK